MDSAQPIYDRFLAAEINLLHKVVKASTRIVDGQKTSRKRLQELIALNAPEYVIESERSLLAKYEVFTTAMNEEHRIMIFHSLLEARQLTFTIRFQELIAPEIEQAMRKPLSSLPSDVQNELLIAFKRQLLRDAVYKFALTDAEMVALMDQEFEKEFKMGGPWIDALLAILKRATQDWGLKTEE